MGLMGTGEFARLSRLSPKALRLYDELGLLRPARVDLDSGYRWYACGQLDQARLVASLRQIAEVTEDSDGPVEWCWPVPPPRSGVPRPGLAAPCPAMIRRPPARPARVLGVFPRVAAQWKPRRRPTASAVLLAWWFPGDPDKWRRADLLDQRISGRDPAGSGA
jgi:hypothetical protein